MQPLAATCAVFLVATLPALAADGDVVLEFGDQGQLTIERPADAISTAQPTGDLALLADGRLLWVAPVADGAVWVGRSLADGAPDPGFGNQGNGRILLDGCTADLPARLLAEPGGGAVVWTGACLLRIDAGGSIDSGFAQGTSPAAGLVAGGLARDTTGRYLLAGTEENVWKVYRFGSDGTPDSGFGTAGMVEIDLPSAFGQRGLEALALRADGRTVVAGWRSNASGPSLVVAQLLDNGQMDPSWHGGTAVDIEAPSFYTSIIATAIAIDRDGSLVVSGRSIPQRLLLARFDTSGQLVPGFGLRLFHLAGSPSLSPFFELRESLIILPGGRILIGTASFLSEPLHRTRYTLVRALTNGAVDPSFGTGGWRSYTISDPSKGGAQSGDYNQLHAMTYAGGSVLLYGRTFFETSSLGVDYLSFLRLGFDRLFADGFEAGLP